MAVAETANLLVKLSLGGNFNSQLSKATRGLKGFDKDASRAYKAGSQIGQGIKNGAKLAAVGVGILTTQIAFGLDQLIQLESLTAQTNATLKSTKGVSGQTADSIRALAESYEGLNAQVDDKSIQNAENVLLTFTKVSKTAFQPALEAALNLSTAMHTDLQGAIVQVGKALSDPIKGITALKRVGVTFTTAQVDAIKELYSWDKKSLAQLKGKKGAERQRAIEAHNATADLKAQKIILAELDKEFGGSFLGGGATTAGKVAKFGDAIEDLQKNLATALLPAIGNIADALNVLLRDPTTIAAFEDLGKQVGKLFSKDNISKGIGLLKDGFGALKAIAGPIADIVGGAVKAFASLPPDIQKILVGGFAVNKLTGGLVTNVFGGIAEAIAKSFIRAPLVNVQGGVVNVGGGIPGGGGGLPGTLAGAAGGIGIATITSTAILAAGTALVAAHLVQGLVDPVGSGARDRANTGKAQTATARGIPDANNKPLNAIKDASKAENRSTLQVEQAAKRGLAAVVAANAKVSTNIETMKSKLAAQLVGTTEAERETKREAAKGAAFGSQGISATNAGASKVAAAVYASTPTVITTVNVTANSVTKTTQVTKRYGSPNGSRNQGNTNEGGMGGH